MLGTDIFYDHQVFKDIEDNGLVSCVTLLADEAEKHAVMMLLERSYGNMAQAAKVARMTRKQFWLLVQKHRIDPTVFVWNRTA